MPYLLAPSSPARAGEPTHHGHRALRGRVRERPRARGSAEGGRFAAVDGGRPSGDVSAAAAGSSVRVRAQTEARWKLPYRSDAGNTPPLLPSRRGDLGPGCGGRADPAIRGRIRRGGKKQMGGRQQNGYQGQCWNCGDPGAYAGGWRMTCHGCEVSWMPWSPVPRGDPARVCWMGKVIDCVDFTRPGALGAPA